MSRRWLGAVVAAVLAFGTVQTVFGEPSPGGQPRNDATWSEIVSLVKSKQPGPACQLALLHENDGDPRIWAFLGDCLSYGQGIEKDHRRAFEYYRKASARIPYAKYRMGLFYATGTAVPCDKDKAVELMDEAIAAGYRPSSRLIRQTHVLLRTPMAEYADPALKLAFPSSSATFQMRFLQRYLNSRTSGYSLRYGAPREWLDLFVYDGGLNVVPDGVSAVSAEELGKAEKAVLFGVEKGMYKNFRDRTATRKGVLPASKLEYAWFSFVYDNKPQNAEGLRSVILIFGARGKFFKIRYSGVVEKGVSPEQLPTMVADFLKHLDAALAAK